MKILFDTNVIIDVDLPSTMKDYIGAAVYVQAGALPSPYSYMKTNYEGNLVKHTNNTLSITAGQRILANQSRDTVYHAYVLIDYVYGSDFASMPATTSDVFLFYIKTQQYTG